MSLDGALAWRLPRRLVVRVALPEAELVLVMVRDVARVLPRHRRVRGAAEVQCRLLRALGAERVGILATDGTLTATAGLYPSSPLPTHSAFTLSFTTRLTWR